MQLLHVFVALVELFFRAAQVDHVRFASRFWEVKDDVRIGGADLLDTLPFRTDYLLVETRLDQYVPRFLVLL